MTFKNIKSSSLMILLAVVVGFLAGLGAILFRWSVSFFHNLFFLGKLSYVYQENAHTPPGVWGLGVVLVPVIGGLIVIWLIEKFAQDERGLSVPKIMYKIQYTQGHIKPVPALAKTLASAISIGSGASIGREGPVAQIGALLSYVIGNIVKLSEEQRKLLIAVGVAAASAGIFNAPLAGIAFATEIFLLSINLFSVFLLIVGALAARIIDALYIGNTPIFFIKLSYHLHDYSLLILYFILLIMLGVILGIVSMLFIRGIYWFETSLNKVFKNAYLRNASCMLVLGWMLFLLMHYFGHYYIQGIGYATIQDCLNLTMSPWFILLLFCCKLLATYLSLGSGASGGIFSPALFLGGTLGTLFGLIFDAAFPNAGINPMIFTLVGMGGMISSTTGAVITGIVLTFELTGDLYSSLSVTITGIVAYAVRWSLCRDSIYTFRMASEIQKGLKP